MHRKMHNDLNAICLAYFTVISWILKEVKYKKSNTSPSDQYVREGGRKGSNTMVGKYLFISHGLIMSHMSQKDVAIEVTNRE